MSNPYLYIHTRRPGQRSGGDAIADARLRAAAINPYTPTRRCVRCKQQRTLDGSTHKGGRFICRFCNRSELP